VGRISQCFRPFTIRWEQAVCSRVEPIAYAHRSAGTPPSRQPPAFPGAMIPELPSHSQDSARCSGREENVGGISGLGEYGGRTKLHGASHEKPHNLWEGTRRPVEALGQRGATGTCVRTPALGCQTRNITLIVRIHRRKTRRPAERAKGWAATTGLSGGSLLPRSESLPVLSGA
jgi:hypothetical protein